MGEAGCVLYGMAGRNAESSGAPSCVIPGASPPLPCARVVYPHGILKLGLGLWGLEEGLRAMHLPGRPMR